MIGCCIAGHGGYGAKSKANSGRKERGRQAAIVAGWLLGRPSLCCHPGEVEGIEGVDGGSGVVIGQLPRCSSSEVVTWRTA